MAALRGELHVEDWLLCEKRKIYTGNKIIEKKVPVALCILVLLCSRRCYYVMRVSPRNCTVLVFRSTLPVPLVFHFVIRVYVGMLLAFQCDCGDVRVIVMLWWCGEWCFDCGA